MSQEPAAQAAPPESLIQPGQKLGSYRVVRLLGRGGMGAVFEAMHLYIERRAAIKVLHPELSQNPLFRSRFLNEARAVNLIKHSSLVEIYEFGIHDDGSAYIVMEFLEGETLGDRMARAGQVPGSEALFVCRQVAVAIAAAHQKDIVHRGQCA